VDDGIGRLAQVLFNSLDSIVWLVASRDPPIFTAHLVRVGNEHDEQKPKIPILSPTASRIHRTYLLEGKKNHLLASVPVWRENARHS
jgi:hypothetical protein